MIDVRDDAEVAYQIKTHASRQRAVAIMRGAQDLREIGEPATAPRESGLDSMREHHRRDVLDVVDPHSGAILVRSKRLRRFARDDVGAMTVHLQLDAERGDGHENVAIHDYVGERRHRSRDAVGLRPFGGLETRGEAGGILFKRLAPFDDLDALTNIANALDIDAQAEAVEQLRAKLAFLRVHGADEDEGR